MLQLKQLKRRMLDSICLCVPVYSLLGTFMSGGQGSTHRQYQHLSQDLRKAADLSHLAETLLDQELCT